MDGLRLILLILGAVVVIGVYLFARGQSRRKVRSQARSELSREPVIELEDALLEADPDEALVEEELTRMEATLRDTPYAGAVEVPAEPVVIAPSRSNAIGKKTPPATAAVPPRQEKIIALHVIAPAHTPFRGKDLLKAFELAALQFGAMKIYHRMMPVDGGLQDAYFVANLVEPGMFDPAHMDTFTTPGISLFLQLPGPVEGVLALDDMVETAKLLASELNGELRDETRSMLSKQRIEHLRSEVLEFERKLRIQHARA